MLFFKGRDQCALNLVSLNRRENFNYLNYKTWEGRKIQKRQIFQCSLRDAYLKANKIAEPFFFVKQKLISIGACKSRNYNFFKKAAALRWVRDGDLTVRLALPSIRLILGVSSLYPLFLSLLPLPFPSPSRNSSITYDSVETLRTPWKKIRTKDF